VEASFAAAAVATTATSNTAVSKWNQCTGATTPAVTTNPPATSLLCKRSAIKVRNSDGGAVLGAVVDPVALLCVKSVDGTGVTLNTGFVVQSSSGSGLFTNE
jgi:hypothetical protein